MSFFTRASNFIINGGNFTIIHPQDTEPRQVLGKRKEREGVIDGHRSSRRKLDELVIVKANEFDLLREISNGNSYRIHLASHGGRFVAVKTFEGPRAKQNWTGDVAFSKEFNVHPNVFKIAGISDERSKSHFILFHGIASDQKMESVIAKALREDLDTSTLLSMKAVRGIAAGLSYITSQNIPIRVGIANSDHKWENFDIFTGNNDEPIISFYPPNTILEDGSVSQTFNVETDGHGIEILSGLCQQLFSGANSILYDDSPERRSNPYDSRELEDLSTAPLEYADSSNPSESEATTSSVSNSLDPTGKSESSQPPRREVWWDPGATNDQSLKSIWWCFEKRLDHFLLSSSNSLLRRIRSPKGNNLTRHLHQCPGYLREEIMLTADVLKSAIVTHTVPNQSELCSICNQLVQYTSDMDVPYSPTDSASRQNMAVRPALPVQSVNPYINIHLNAAHLIRVKYQILNCHGKDIIIGRLKINMPNDDHVFIIRRFDTGAVSLTTMFRAAFPNASYGEEKLEFAWVKNTYDLSGNNGSTRSAHIPRLAGVWVGPSVALELGRAYMLGRHIEAVVEAEPDPNGNYTRSGRSAAGTTR